MTKRAAFGLVLLVAAAMGVSSQYAHAKDYPITIEVMKPGEFSIPGIRKLAVAPFGGRSGEAVCNALTAKLFEGGTFTIMERAKIDAIMKEHSLTMEGMVNPETAREVGKLAGVDAMVFGQVDDFGVTDQQGVVPLKKKRLLGRDGAGEEVWEGYSANCPSTIRNGRIGVTFKMVNIESGQIVAMKNANAAFEGQQVVNPNTDPWNYGLFEANPYDKLKQSIATADAVEVSMVDQVSRAFLNSVSAHKEQVTLIWDDDIGKGGEAVVKMLLAGMPAEATEMVRAQTAALEADRKANPKKIMAAYYDCGLVSEASGDPEKALEWYKKAVTKDPTKATSNQMAAMARIRKSIDDTKKLQNQQSN